MQEMWGKMKTRLEFVKTEKYGQLVDLHYKVLK